MLRLVKALAGLVLALIVAGVSGATVDDLWIGLGGSDTGGGISNDVRSSANPDVAVTNEGYPVVAWQNGTFGVEEIYVRQWDGAAWVELGGSASGGGISNSGFDSVLPSIVVNPVTNFPVVAWTEMRSSDSEIYVRQWNGSAWIEPIPGSASIGGVSNNSGTSEEPCLAVSSGGVVGLAWSDNSTGNYEVLVRHPSVGGWVDFGSSAQPGGISDDSADSKEPSIAFDPNTQEIMAVWTSGTGPSSRVYARRTGAGVWGEVGSGSASGDGISGAGANDPSLMVDSLSRPVVAYSIPVASDECIYVARFSGSAWEEFAPGSASGGGVSPPGEWSDQPRIVAGFSSNPLLSFGVAAPLSQSRRVAFLHWSFGAFAELGTGSGDSPGLSSSPILGHSLAYDPIGQRPYVAYSRAGSEVYVRTTAPGTLAATLSTHDPTLWR
jgi:hypothetical protein